MPTYAYACTACDHRFEVVQSFTDDSLTVCPECGGRLRKIFNAVGIVFKGNGFYRTDSRKEPVPAGSSAASKDSGKDSGKDSRKDSGEDSGKGPSKESDSSSRSSGSNASPSSTPSSTGAKGATAPAATASTSAN